MCLFVLLVLGALAIFKFSSHPDIKIGRFFSVFSARTSDRMRLGDIELGTTMEMLRERHPNAIKTASAHGVVTLAFARDNNRYTVWYAKEGSYRVAYKARRNLDVGGVSEDEYLRKITQRYGAPSLSSCSKSLIDGLRNCRYTWWLPGRIRLDVDSRQDIHAAVARLRITTQITDTQLAGRLAAPPGPRP